MFLSSSVLPPLGTFGLENIVNTRKMARCWIWFASKKSCASAILAVRMRYIMLHEKARYLGYFESAIYG
jgi:hypothetical protein